jgi:hypothetical protein
MAIFFCTVKISPEARAGKRGGAGKNINIGESKAEY